MSKAQIDKKDLKYILNLLREGTVQWQGRSKCLERFRKKVFERMSLKGKPIYKFFWTCALCSKDYRNISDVQVDHIYEVGSYKGDLHDYISRLYCDQDNLQVLCVYCHQVKTSNFNATLRLERKKKNV